MFIYSQSTGRMTLDGKVIGIGYSGHDIGKNNPGLQKVHNVGPIPVGMWKISHFFNHPVLGPNVAALTPEDETETFGRGGFYIHGDSASHPGFASHGCIVQGPIARAAIAESGDTLLQVMA